MSKNNNYSTGNTCTIFYQVTSQLFPLSNTPQLFPSSFLPTFLHLHNFSSCINTSLFLQGVPHYQLISLLPIHSPRDKLHTPQPPFVSSIVAKIFSATIPVIHQFIYSLPQQMIVVGNQIKIPKCDIISALLEPTVQGGAQTSLNEHTQKCKMTSDLNN